jgi:hypothetical protein
MPGPEAGEAPDCVEDLRPGSPLTLPRRDSSSRALEGVDLGVEMPLREDESFMIDVICKGFGSIL